MVAYRKAYVSLQGDERDLKRRLAAEPREARRLGQRVELGGERR
jgi:hypothetical protein